MRTRRTSAEPARRAPRKAARESADATESAAAEIPAHLGAGAGAEDPAVPVAIPSARAKAVRAVSPPTAPAETVAAVHLPPATAGAVPTVPVLPNPAATDGPGTAVHLPPTTAGAVPTVPVLPNPITTAGAVPTVPVLPNPTATAGAVPAVPLPPNPTAYVESALAADAGGSPAPAPSETPDVTPAVATAAAAPPSGTVSSQGRLLTRAVLWPVRLAARHLWVTVAAGTAVLTALLSWLLGPGLSQYLEAQGMDDERAYLLSAVVLVILATAVAGAASRRTASTRAGGLIGFVGIQIVPFLIRAATQPNIQGLKYTQDIAGWILQPLGMLLLAVIGVIVGAALGVGLARDATRLPSLFRRRRSWPAVPVAIALVVVSSGAAVTALQDGPLSALRSYSVPTADAPATPSPSATGAGGPSVAVTAPTADPSVYLALPGKIEYETVANRQVDVYVPDVAFADPSLHLPVLYLLHGTPGQQADWLTGGQLEPILDQDIANGTIPPMIVVLPNGNTARSTDTEWGDSPSGDVEAWIVNQVIPAIDTQYNTLPGYCGIAGLSSGGYGAVNIAFQNPTVFSWAGSYSGYFVGYQSTFGTGWKANSPLYTASTVPIAERMPIYLGAGSTDYVFKPDTVQFDSTLTALGWPEVDYQTVPGGHGWVAWTAEMEQSLQWLGQLWGPEPWLQPLGPAPAVAAAGHAGSVGAL